VNGYQTLNELLPVCDLLHCLLQNPVKGGLRMKKSNAPAGARTPFQKWVDKYQGLFYLIPWIIGFVVFKAVPFGQSLYYSFTDMNFFTSS